MRIKEAEKKCNERQQQAHCVEKKQLLLARKGGELDV
jgi:hypothetical protein